MDNFNFHKVEYFKKRIFVFDTHLYKPLKKTTISWVHKSYFIFPFLHKNERIAYSMNSFFG